MTRKEFFEIAGYIANPVRQARIELEARQTTIANYNPIYFSKTGRNLPMGTDSITSLDDGANKWGREMRIYFILTDVNTIPNTISNIMTDNNRPGYETWNKRLNNRQIIDDLLGIGFILGNPQNEADIRAQVPQADLADFDIGFNA